MTTRNPIACDLTAIEGDERDPHRRAADRVFGAVHDVKELSDGYALEMEAETNVIEQAGAFVARERLCCPFFHFALKVEPNSGPVRLEVTGREGVKEFIEELLLPHLDSQKREE